MLPTGADADADDHVVPTALTVAPSDRAPRLSDGG
jgi:hypothetical protein